MPSSRVAKRAIIEALPSNINSIYDLGSGWGGLVFSLARARPGCRVHGYELSWLPWLYSSILCLGHHHVKLHRKNFYKISLADADLIVCYLYPGAMKKLETQFAQQLRPGTIVITNTFTLPSWIPLKTIALNDFWKSSIYVYEKPH